MSRRGDLINCADEFWHSSAEEPGEFIDRILALILPETPEEGMVEAAAKGAYNQGASEIDPDWNDLKQWIKDSLWIDPQRAAWTAARKWWLG